MTTKRGRKPMEKPNPSISVRMPFWAKQDFLDSLPEGALPGRVGRERLLVVPEPSELDVSEAVRALEFLALPEFTRCSKAKLGVALRSIYVLPKTKQAPKNKTEDERAAIQAQLDAEQEQREAYVRRWAAAGEQFVRPIIEGAETESSDEHLGRRAAKGVLAQASVKVVLSAADYELFVLRAKALGLTVNTYARRMLEQAPVVMFEEHMGVDSVLAHAQGAIKVRREGGYGYDHTAVAPTPVIQAEQELFASLMEPV